MAYNKDNYEQQRLSPKQEKFVEGILEGKSQYEAYITAYPNSKNWKRNSVDSNASELMDSPKIKQRLMEFGYKDKTKVIWTRQKALETINKAMEMHQQDMERIEQAYQQDLDRKDYELQQWVQLLAVDNVDTKHVQAHINQLLDEMSDLRKKRRVNAVNTHGIYEGAKILNRMFGFDITKVEINQEDEERNEMEKLTAEELKQLISISKKGE